MQYIFKAYGQFLFIYLNLPPITIHSIINKSNLWNPMIDNTKIIFHFDRITRHSHHSTNTMLFINVIIHPIDYDVLFSPYLKNNNIAVCIAFRIAYKEFLTYLNGRFHRGRAHNPRTIIDYSMERGLDRNQMNRLASLDFIREHNSNE